MAQLPATLLAFNRGEVSKIALARVDVERLRMSAQCQVNWMPFVLGPMMLRPGLAFIGEVYNDAPCVLMDFIYAKTDTALIELTDQLLRIWINDQLVTRPAVATVVLDPDMTGAGSHWATGDTTGGCTATITGGVMTLAAPAAGGLARTKQTLTVATGDQNVEHGLRIVVSNGPVTVRAGSTDHGTDYIGTTTLDTGTHSLALTPTGASVFLEIESIDAWNKTITGVTIEAAGVLTLPTPWAEADLSNLRWTHSGDIIYAACYGRQQYKIERRGIRPGARGWSVVKYRSNNGPFANDGANGTDITLTPSALSGNTDLTASRPYFDAGHVGALFRLFSSGQTTASSLVAQNTFTPAVRISGVGEDRRFAYTIANTYVGTLKLQRSLESATSGFIDVSTVTVSDTLADGLNNVIAWYRIGFKTGGYTSGQADIALSYAGGGAFGIARVTGYTSTTVVSVEVLSAFSSLNATSDWNESDWSDRLGWPTSVCFYEGRLWWFGRDRFWGSQSNFYTGYADIDSTGETLGNAGVIIESFGEGPVDTVSWGLPLSRLLCGREQSIASVRSSSFDTPLTPGDLTAKDCSEQGAARVPGIKIGKRGVFVGQSGRKVYELAFVAQNADYSDRDLTRLNIDIGRPGLLDTAMAVQPDKTLLFPRGDGELACLLYDPADEVEAWWRIMTLGWIERARVLPNPSGGDDFVYAIVKRKINGDTRRFIEKLAQRDDCVGGLQNHQLDSYLTYSGAPASTISLPHLPNTLVKIWADGQNLGEVSTDSTGLATLPDSATASDIVAGIAGFIERYEGALTSTMPGLINYEGLPCEVFADQQPSGKLRYCGTLTVSGGVLTLPNGWQATQFVACFGYVAPFMSAKLAYSMPGGLPVTQKKAINSVGLIMFDAGAQSLSYGQGFDQLDDMPGQEAGADVPSETVWSEYDEPVIEIGKDWETDSRLCLLAQAPNPVKVGGAAILIGS